jgi:hypothetical protein
VSIRASHVERWDVLPVNQILEENGEIYDSYLPDQRTLVEDLESLDMVDASGAEIRIYDKNGKKISRREAFCDMDAPSCGSLVDLCNVGMLFQDPGELVGRDAPWIRGYPMAFLHNVGHIQANRVLTAFEDVLTRINQHCYMEMSHSNPHDYPPEDGVYIVENPVVIGLSSQIYNEVTHRASHRAGAHDVQKGHITAALAGGWAKAASTAKNQAKTLAAQCSVMLPHQRFKEKVDDDSCPRDMRFEQVYHMDLKSLPASSRNGR